MNNQYIPVDKYGRRSDQAPEEIVGYRCKLCGKVNEHIKGCPVVIAEEEVQADE